MVATVLIGRLTGSFGVRARVLGLGDDLDSQFAQEIEASSVRNRVSDRWALIRHLPLVPHNIGDVVYKYGRYRGAGTQTWTWFGSYTAARHPDSTREAFYIGAGILVHNAEVDPSLAVTFVDRLRVEVSDRLRPAMVCSGSINDDAKLSSLFGPCGQIAALEGVNGDDLILSTRSMVASQHGRDRGGVFVSTTSPEAGGGLRRELHRILDHAQDFPLFDELYISGSPQLRRSARTIPQLEVMTADVWLQRPHQAGSGTAPQPSVAYTTPQAASSESISGKEPFMEPVHVTDVPASSPQMQGLKEADSLDQRLDWISASLTVANDRIEKLVRTIAKLDPKLFVDGELQPIQSLSHGRRPKAWLLNSLIVTLAALAAIFLIYELTRTGDLPIQLKVARPPLWTSAQAPADQTPQYVPQTTAPATVCASSPLAPTATAVQQRAALEAERGCLTGNMAAEQARVTDIGRLLDRDPPLAQPTPVACRTAGGANCITQPGSTPSSTVGHGHEVEAQRHLGSKRPGRPAAHRTETLKNGPAKPIASKIAPNTIQPVGKISKQGGPASETRWDPAPAPKAAKPE